MMTSSITAGHTVTQNAWSRPSTAYAGVAACALIFGALVGVAGLVMTIKGSINKQPDDIIDPAESSTLPILGPIFLAIGVLFLLAGISMCMYARYPMRRRAGANREQAGIEDCEDESRCPQD